MTSSRPMRCLVVAGLMVATCAAHLPGSVASASPARPTKPLPEKGVVAQFCARFERLAVELALPLRITHCETQRGAGKRALVVQSDDPIAIIEQEIDAGAIPTDGDEVAERTLYGPLRVYRDAVRPGQAKLLSRVDQLILSYRDRQQTVFDIKPKVMRRYLSGDLDDQEFSDRILITGL